MRLDGSGYTQVRKIPSIEICKALHDRLHRSVTPFPAQSEFVAAPGYCGKGRQLSEGNGITHTTSFQFPSGTGHRKNLLPSADNLQPGIPLSEA